MKKLFLRNESGYSLLVVLMVMTLLSVVGLMVMGITVNSVKHVTVNEQSVKVKSATDMAIEEAMAQIDREVEELNKDIKNKTILIDAVVSRLNNSLNNLKSLGTLPYTIQTQTIKDGSEGIYQEKVTIKTPVGTSGKFATRTILISSINNVFKYSTVTPGDLVLNGAAYIEGDVRVGGNLYSSNYGKYVDGINLYEKTSFPALNGNLTVLGNHNRLSNMDRRGNWFFGYYYVPVFQNFSPTPVELKKYFSVVPRMPVNSLPVEKVDVAAMILKKSGNLSSSKTLGSLNVNANETVRLTGNYTINNDLVMKEGSRLEVNGSLKVKGNAELSGTITTQNPNDYIYIQGKSSSPVTISNLTLSGQMYLGYSLDIQNNLNTNGSIYVMGNIDVANFTNNDPGTLLLLAEGDIKVSNNNLYNDLPKPINAFLYSNSQLEIYGIGSHLKITGGIYGKDIILNAVKGKTKKGSGSSLIFESNQDGLPPESSRLSVIYKKDLILNPPTGIPVSSELSVEILDTEYE
ncbi:hypothetical protein LC048_04330 [Mesobacillus subterraneus]|uniref:hypothetical protein n=1 Tax=Mesobacillus subterraneus TaxID=285983 RepID=UPI001CFDE036|nr:hypothetical protein [Mesobacillus subterraneus]WLR56178.1 hypothetical protein LC048_04330 [Mesobacillus subterraneus]